MMPSSASAGRTESQEHLRVPAGDLLGALADAAQLLARRQSVGRAHRQAHLVAAFEARDPHHVELVEIRREDRQELGALQQRQRRVGGQRQHPGVEVQPAQFPVEVAVLGQRVVDEASVASAVAAGGASGAALPSDTQLGVGRSSLGFGHTRSSPMGDARGYAWLIQVHRRRRSVRRADCATSSQARRRAASRPTDRRGCRCRSAAPATRPVSSTAPESAVAPCGIGPEVGVERDAEREQCRGARAVPVADEAALVAARGGDRLGQLLRLQRGQIALQHNDVRASRADRRLGGRAARCSSGSGWPAGVGSTSTWAPSSRAASAATLVGGDDGDRAHRRHRGGGADGVHQHREHHVLPGLPPRTTGASRVLAAPSRLTAMISPTSASRRRRAGAAHGCHPASRRDGRVAG